MILQTLTDAIYTDTFPTHAPSLAQIHIHSSFYEPNKWIGYYYECTHVRSLLHNNSPIKLQTGTDSTYTIPTHRLIFLLPVNSVTFDIIWKSEGSVGGVGYVSTLTLFSFVLVIVFIISFLFRYSFHHFCVLVSVIVNVFITFSLLCISVFVFVNDNHIGVSHWLSLI